MEQPRLPSPFTMTMVAFTIVLGMGVAGSAACRLLYADSDNKVAVQGPGEAWDGEGKGNMTEEDVADFNAFPLLWLGTSYLGYNLTAIQLTQTTVGGLPYTEAYPTVIFIYGDCDPGGGYEPRCSLPLQVHITSVCTVPAADRAISNEMPGVAASRIAARMTRHADGQILLWTADLQISISTSLGANVPTEAIAALHGVGRASAITTASDLPAPSWDACE